MGDLSKNFSRKEFACQGKDCCGGSSPIDSRLVDALQLFRDKIGKPLKVNSGFRCITHNAIVGGEPDSQHTKGYAADIAIVDGMTVEQMRGTAETIGAFQYGGIGLYNTFIHLDVRPDGPARWDYRK